MDEAEEEHEEEADDGIYHHHFQFAAREEECELLIRIGQPSGVCASYFCRCVFLLMLACLLSFA